MSFKKYQVFLIGLSTTLLMTACTQAGAKIVSGIRTTDSISTTTNTNYFLIKTSILNTMKRQLLRLIY